MATDALVECVPNFSEGRDSDIIDRIAETINATEGVTLLDVDAGQDFNRTVMTFVGEPESVLRAAFNCTRKALELIDMRSHSGEHARMGAVDVVPFIPIAGVSMEDCIDLAERFAKRVGSELRIPVYLYAAAARTPARVLLPKIRAGEYEGLQNRLSEAEWAPDEGPAQFIPRSGATASGARSVLIAYNVNLNTDDKAAAGLIAGKLRTSGILKRDQHGEKILGPDGRPERIPGRFEALQAAGWMYDGETAQVSMNLLDHLTTGLHEVTNAIRLEAEAMDLEVTAGELVGLVPLEALTAAGRHFLAREDAASQQELVESAIDGLKLDVLSDFIPERRIIEYAAGIRG